MVNDITLQWVEDKQGRKWILLNKLGDTGNIKAATINKPRQVLEDDGHHCHEANLKGSIRYYPKKWLIN